MCIIPTNSWEIMGSKGGSDLAFGVASYLVLLFAMWLVRSYASVYLPRKLSARAFFPARILSESFDLLETFL